MKKTVSLIIFIFIAVSELCISMGHADAIGLQIKPTQKIMVTATAYCKCDKCCGKYADGITYLGTRATPKQTIAVDPDIIPFRSTVIIGGEKYIAEDTGYLIKGNRIDIFFATHKEALNWGVKKIEIEVEVE